MNIEQIKSDLDNGVIVSRETWCKLVEAALMMKSDLLLIANVNVGNEVGGNECVVHAQAGLELVEAL